MSNDFLELYLNDGDECKIRRSTLVAIKGSFDLSIASLSKSAISFGNAFGMPAKVTNIKAKSPTSVVANLDYWGEIVPLDVSEVEALYINPRLYVGHIGRVTVSYKVLSKKEAWAMAHVFGEGTVFIKTSGVAIFGDLSSEKTVLDTNNIAAIRSPFQLDTKVLKLNQVLRSGEMENIALTGSGEYVLQSINANNAHNGLWGSITSIFS